ncbi:lycopene cyclase [Hoyosella rhizosphaerae]|uniref:Lycopene cyclase n=1 Tax=Hoyosella rhizosphaerae TaxID=1755582 RepID=A0A916U3X7_9ACTN|nr:lycopene cyclase family protein [Hoyosella rhizosphaerae]MBN4926507.1 lycopene cyclase [Hoyosella rhizosphaerae]GGC58754.1 lycopene cyclase [Hoyosella rhizosphaerae]
MHLTTDVVVAGLGPSGRAVAARCLARGLSVVAIDRHAHRRWTPTYAAWLDELPQWVPQDVIRSRIHRPQSWGNQNWTIPREYVVLDTPKLQTSLSLSHGTVLSGDVEEVAPQRVRLTNGDEVRGRVVIDARGLPREKDAPEQTAFGVFVRREQAKPVLGDAPGLFMDWRGSGKYSQPSFLYAIPVDEDTVLLEETCLVGAPAVPLDELQNRLRARLRRHGVSLSGQEPVERVRFPVSGPAVVTNNRPGMMTVGARGGFLHPATGFSVARSLTIADEIARCVEAGITDLDPLVWTARSRAVYKLRLRGLRVLLGMSGAELPEFFDAFFALPVDRQRAYVSDAEDPVALSRAMLAMFKGVAWKQRAKLMRAVV